MRYTLTLLSAAVLAAGLPRAAFAQDIMQYALTAPVPQAQMLAPGELPSGGGIVVIPQSSLPQPAGFAHTMLQIFVPEKRPGPNAVQPNAVYVPVTGVFLNTPQSHACVYGLVAFTAGCNPETLLKTKIATGGTKGVAIVIAFHHPTAKTDLKEYSAQFGLPAPTAANFQVFTLGSPGPRAGDGHGIRALDGAGREDHCSRGNDQFLRRFGRSRGQGEPASHHAVQRWSNLE